jgi:hypothetical protein
MARAEAVEPEEGIPAIVERAGEAMILIIPRAMWETLVLQGQAENLPPGRVLDKALREYLEKHGCQEAVDYLFRVSGQKQG